MRRLFPLALVAMILVAGIPAPVKQVELPAEVPLVVPAEVPLVLPTATPLPTPTATLTPTPTATVTPTVGVHHAMMAHRCMDFVAAVYSVSVDFPDIDPTLVLAIAAKESGCDPSGTDVYSESAGLMQVNPASLAHLGITKSALMDPLRNIYWGMRILRRTLTDHEHNPEGDVPTALAAYNCGWTSLEAGRCYSFGGYVYAASIMEEWVPAIRQALNEYVNDPPDALGKWKLREDVLAWLGTWGYTASNP